MGRTKITEEEDEFILTNYKYMTIMEIAKKLGRGRSSVQNRLKIYGVTGTKRQHDIGYFKKGHQPWNKGLKQMTSEKCLPTLFKKGQPSTNTKPVGTIVFKVKDGSGQGYYDYYIKYKEHAWMSLRQWTWMKHNGEVPPGHIIVYKNKRHDFSIDNLLCISRAENVRRNYNGKRVKAHYSSGLAFTPEYCATRVSIYNKELKQELLQNPELLEIIQNNMKLKRQIKCKKESQKN